MDWTKGALLPNYVRAAVNTRLVGKQLALLLQHLNLLGTPPALFHLIGFSLGAHVGGYAGSEIANLSRITGLDPAGPLYESYDKKVRLDQTDALFVDVIHSNGDSLIMGGLGSWEPMGNRTPPPPTSALLTPPSLSRSRRLLPERRSSPEGLFESLPRRRPGLSLV